MRLFASIGTALIAAGLAFAAHASTFSVYLDQPSFNVAASTSLLETFEAVVPKDTVLVSFISNGVIYTGIGGVPVPNVWVASPGYNNFGAGVGLTTTSILTANGDEDFTLTFSTPPTAVGFDAYLNGLGNVTVTINGGTFTFIDARNLDDKQYYGFITSDPIVTLRFASTAGGTLNTGIDNVSVGAARVAGVPEPATLALFGAGLAGLGALRRRRKAKA